MGTISIIVFYNRRTLRLNIGEIPEVNPVLVLQSLAVARVED